MNGFEGSYQTPKFSNETVFKIVERKWTNFSLPQKKQQLYEGIWRVLSSAQDYQWNNF
jgi:hypothetical protein